MKTSLVVTTISAPTPAMQALAADSKRRGLDFLVVGDSSSPSNFDLAGCDYYSVDRQLKSRFRYASAAPLRHYARKNIGYLLSIDNGAEIVVETDDDNYPLPAFFSERKRVQRAHVLENHGWINVYAYFSETHVWPRGFPLDAVRQPVSPLGDGPLREVDCPIQQGLCNGDPDVDAIYRLVSALPVDFLDRSSVALGNGSWCPFNSQNTSWWRDAFPLLYLPGTCSIRMTDIWRGLLAQRIAWINGWSVLFHSPTVSQERNAHNLMRDFSDEISGYLNNRKLVEHLQALSLRPGLENIPDNLLRCYDELALLGFVDLRELQLLEAWLSDLSEIGFSRDPAAVSKC